MKNITKFSDIEFKFRSDFFGGIYARVDYDNGYTASIVKGPYTYGGSEGLYEIAVLQDGELCYGTSVTSDVVGWLTEDGVEETLAKIQALV